MDGVMIINKPQGISSHDVVAEIRRRLGVKRVGHTGTLDPLATGVLVLCINRATRLVQYLTCEDKVYEVQMKFGIKTDTGDRTGKIIEKNTNEIDEEKIGDVLSNFIGPQKQIPPMYSAIKVNGKKLYEYARQGITIEREPRDIEIYDIYDVLYGNNILKFSIHCSKGTYIRTVCEDIAEKLNTVGTMTELKRLQSGNFTIDQAVDFDDANEKDIIDLEDLFDNEVVIKKDKMFGFINGLPIYYNLPDGMYRLYFDNYITKKFIGLGSIKDKFLYREIIL